MSTDDQDALAEHAHDWHSMHPMLDAFARSWPWNPWLVATLILAATIYVRGFTTLRRRDPFQWPISRLIAYLCGLASLYLALASPIEPFASLLLQVHMLQHLLLMMFVPPLIYLGAPLFPLLNGLPRSIRRFWLAPFLQSRGIRSFFSLVTHPAVALPLFTAATWLWHLPDVYVAALQRPWLHTFQHLSFLLAGLIFWYPVIRPFPAHPIWSKWLLLPYLLLADVQNTVLSAILTFSDRVLYPYYTHMPRIAGVTALEDQANAGVLMWVPGSIAFLGPLCWIGIGLLFGEQAVPTPARPRLPAVRTSPQSQFDLLRVPFIGSFLRSRYGRRVAQISLAIVAGLVIYDGLRGPQVGAMNLAGVLPWIHWRGMLVFGLFIAGNFFCFACPFTLPRAVAQRWLPQVFNWPSALKNKWLAAGMLLLFLWSYEAFSLWDSPWITAWITLSYFLAAFLIEGLFRRGSFCKYVCPIGQFNFIHSLISPFQVRVREPSICATCTTHECLRGSETVRGCETMLFQPQKQGNMDCTFCMNCVRACPHDNVGILQSSRLVQLTGESGRSSAGRSAHRSDLAVMIVLLAFGAFANAAGMVGPVVDLQNEWSRQFGQHSHVFATSLFYLVALIGLPALLFALAITANRQMSHLENTGRELATRFAYAFVPIGFAMWVAHYSFHFLTSCETIIPVSQRLARDLSIWGGGEPAWSRACCRPLTDSLLKFELLTLDIGFLVSLFVVWKIAESMSTASVRTWKIAAPWSGLISILFALGIWIVFQPMQMRGTLPGSG